MKINRIISAMIVLILTSCSSSQKSYVAYESNPSETYTKQKAQSDKPENDSRMMIYNASMTIESDHPDTVSAQVSGLVKKYGGYILNSGNNYITLRIESSNLYKVMDEIAQLGKLKDKNIQGIDVTDEFKDNKIRLDNAIKTRNRYLEMLQKASTIDEVLKVEKELERLNREIDLLEGKMNKIEHLVAYSTIHVKYEQKVKPGIIGYIGIGLYKGIKWLFVR
jgi:PBP1b-binding outer membrane lipoprotein LpoB